MAVFGGLIFWVGIEKLFLLSIGGDGFSVSINAVAFVAVVLALDVPTGALADRWGRKRLLLTGLGCLFLSSLSYSLSHSPKTYLLGTIFFAAALATINGATQALTYDSLEQTGKASDYNKVHGRLQAALAVGAGTGLLLSGFIAQHYGFRFNFRISLITSVLAFVASLWIVEPNKDNAKQRIALTDAIKQSIATIKKSQVLIAAAVLFLITTALRWMSDNYSQLVFSRFGVHLSYVGVLGFLAVAGGAVGRLVSHRYQKYGRWLTLVIMALFGLVAFAPKPIALFGLISFYGFNQLVQNICESEIQEHLPSHIRATATSVFTFISTMLIIPFGLLTGLLIRRYGVLSAFQLGLVLGAGALAWWWTHTRADMVVKSQDESSELIEVID